MTPSSLGKRAANYFIDIAFSVMFSGILLFVTSRLAYIVVDPKWFADRHEVGLLLSLAIFCVYLFVYYFVSESRWGKTPAKFLTNTKVVSDRSSPVRPTQIVGRTLARLIPLDEFSIFFGGNQKTWHDSLSHTLVVEDSTNANTSKSKVIKYSLFVILGLIVIGMIWAQFDKVKNGPLTNLYEITSLPSGYTLDSVVTKEFSDQPYVEVRYKGQPVTLSAGSVATYYIDVNQFNKGTTKFSPPSNCGFTHPIDPLLGEKVYGKIQCHLEQEVAGYKLYAPDNSEESKLGNGNGVNTYYVDHEDVIITISGPLDLDAVTNIVNSIQKTGLQALKQKIGTSSSSGQNQDQANSCQSNPVPGSIEFDIPPGPKTDSQAGEIARSVGASYPRLRDGSIVKVNGIGYPSGKYTLTVTQGTETTAIAKIKSLTYVTYVDQVKSYCAPTQPKLKVE